MGSNWENFLKNLGEWQGSFTQLSPNGEEQKNILSLLTLEGHENNQMVRFRLRRYGTGCYTDPPTQDYSQDYTNLARQNIFFETGAFSKGTLQLAPYAEFGAEYGFVHQDRRLRLVQLFDTDGNLSSLTLIREFRSQTSATEYPPLNVSQLIGTWVGTAHTCYADWRPAEHQPSHLEISLSGPDQLIQAESRGEVSLTCKAQIAGRQLQFEGAFGQEMLLLPDGAFSCIPNPLQRHHPFTLEVGWLIGENQRQRLIRSYSDRGEWISSTHICEQKQSL